MEIKERLKYYESVLDMHYGLEVLEIGESFKSGCFPEEFVPIKNG
jgi:hypothetical protein